MTLADFFATKGTSTRRRTSPNIWKRLAVWQTRRALADLDADALRDIGLSAEEAQREARRGAWDVPDSWRAR